MTHQLAQPHVATPKDRPRRRWSDVHPVVVAAFCAGLAALIFHALPDDRDLHGLRNVLTVTGLVTALAVLGLMLLERFGRTPGGRRHPGRRNGDFR